MWKNPHIESFIGNAMNKYLNNYKLITERNDGLVKSSCQHEDLNTVKMQVTRELSSCKVAAQP